MTSISKKKESIYDINNLERLLTSTSEDLQFEFVMLYVRNWLGTGSPKKKENKRLGTALRE